MPVSRSCDVLTEVRDVRQEPGGHRRWFQDDDLELIVWEDQGGGVEGFQLCYTVGVAERALTWRRKTGFSHARIDPGDATPLKNQTPILTPDGAVPWATVEKLFAGRSAGLETGLREWIAERLAVRR